MSGDEKESDALMVKYGKKGWRESVVLSAHGFPFDQPTGGSDSPELDRVCWGILECLDMYGLQWVSPYLLHPLLGATWLGVCGGVALPRSTWAV